MKDTRLGEQILNENATIYSKRESKSEKEKWGDLTGKEKVQYFMDYYLKIVLIIGIGAIFVIWLLYTILSPKPETALNITMVSGFLDEETDAQLSNTMMELLALDPKTEQVFLDTSLYIKDGEVSEITSASEQKMTIYAYAGEMDLVIAERDVFERYAKNGFFMDLTKALPTNLYSRLSKQFLMTQAQDIDIEEVPYGISLSDFANFESLNAMMKDPVIGISAGTKHESNALTALEWFTE